MHKAQRRTKSRARQKKTPPFQTTQPRHKRTLAATKVAMAVTHKEI